MKFYQERDLPSQDALRRLFDGKPCRAIDFREGLLVTRARRPFHGKGVGDNSGGIGLPFECPGSYDLSSGLSGRWQLDERRLGRLNTRFFSELPLCRGERIFIRPVLSFWDRPCAKILLRPKRSAGMNEKNFKRLTASSVHEQAGAGFSHERILSIHGDISPLFSNEYGTMGLVHYG